MVKERLLVLFYPQPKRGSIVRGGVREKEVAQVLNTRTHTPPPSPGYLTVVYVEIPALPIGYLDHPVTELRAPPSFPLLPPAHAHTQTYWCSSTLSVMARINAADWSDTTTNKKLKRNERARQFSSSFLSSSSHSAPRFNTFPFFPPPSLSLHGQRTLCVCSECVGSSTILYGHSSTHLTSSSSSSSSMAKYRTMRSPTQAH